MVLGQSYEQFALLFRLCEVAQQPWQSSPLCISTIEKIPFNAMGKIATVAAQPRKDGRGEIPTGRAGIKIFKPKQSREKLKN